MTRRLDEEEAAMNATVLDVALSLGGQFLSEIGRVLIFDIFDNWIPANIRQYIGEVSQWRQVLTIGRC